MKVRVLGLLGVALTVCLSSALVAQEEGRGPGRGRGGPGGPGGFGFGGGGPQMGGGALELIGLLRMEEVRKEVEMTDETFQALQGAMPDMREIFRAEESERAAKMKEANTQAQEMIDEALSPEQQKRLMGLLVQQNGSRAALNSMVAKQIGLDEAGMKKAQEAAAKASEGMRDKMRELFTAGGGPEGVDRDKMREMMQNAQKDVDKAIGDTLSDAQKKALEDLKGEKFEFPENRGFGRGPGGPGGPGEGNRPRGNRPAGERPAGDN